MKLIVLDDLYDWGTNLEDDEETLKTIEKYRKKFILNNSEFILKMFPNNQFYVNVNTPLTNSTWKRVWDAPDVITLESTPTVMTTTVQPTSFTPDPTCPTSITFYGGSLDSIAAASTGEPSVDLNLLTVCEKMNVYINRNTGVMYILDPSDCTWLILKAASANATTWDDILNKPTIYSGIEHVIDTDNSQLTVSLTTDGITSSDVDVTSVDDLDDVL